MIIVLKPEVTEPEIEHIMERLQELGLKSHVSHGQERTIIGVIGDDRILQNQPLTALPGVESVLPILAPWKLVSREFRKENTVIDVGGVKIGGKKLAMMAGPCAVERLELTVGIAQEVKSGGASILRDGAYKPRSSPYSFQGLGREGLDYLLEAKKKTGLPVISEILDTRDIELFLEKADIIQIGARNMQNFELLKEVGAYDKPVLLKRGLSATIKEFLLSAEYIMSRGNRNVMLCERPRGHSDAEGIVAPAGHRGSEPRHRQVEPGRAHVQGGDRRGRRRPADRSALESGMRPVRRRGVHQAQQVQGSDAGHQENRRGGRTGSLSSMSQPLEDRDE
jgi:3-deoxy-7-phosphoheptulonate synthase